MHARLPLKDQCVPSPFQNMARPRRLLRLSVALALAASLAAADFVTLSTRYSADPSPFVGAQDGRLYVTATHDEVDAHSFSMLDYNVFSTDDGVNWRDDGIAFSPVSNTTWARNAWAQQVIWHAPMSKYVMFFPGLVESGADGPRRERAGAAQAPRRPRAVSTSRRAAIASDDKSPWRIERPFGRRMKRILIHSY